MRHPVNHSQTYGSFSVVLEEMNWQGKKTRVWARHVKRDLHAETRRVRKSAALSFEPGGAELAKSQDTRNRLATRFSQGV
jgi:hypothetical protein